jgi:putative FmdB family regulatory protein
MPGSNPNSKTDNMAKKRAALAAASLFIAKIMEQPMPTYEYACENCGHSFEKFQSMNDTPVELCPLCGSSVKRLIGSGGGVIFKSGFHTNDYPQSASSPQTRCGKQTPCCGRDVPCESPRCDTD